MAIQLAYSTKILFDTNVLVSAFLSKGTAAHVYEYCAERYVLCATDWTLNELRQVLSRPKFQFPITSQDNILKQVMADNQLVSSTNELPTDSPDPDDNNILQAALFVSANFLITGDTKHLLPLKRVADTEIISPRAFYEQYIA